MNCVRPLSRAPCSENHDVMAYVIAAPCVSEFSCVEICPVNAIHPGPSDPVFDAAEQLYIDPDTCINCGVCVEACPVLAIYRSEEHTSELQSLMRISYAVFCLKKKTKRIRNAIQIKCEINHSTQTSTDRVNKKD